MRRGRGERGEKGNSVGDGVGRVERERMEGERG